MQLTGNCSQRYRRLGMKIIMEWALGMGMGLRIWHRLRLATPISRMSLVAACLAECTSSLVGLTQGPYDTIKKDYYRNHAEK